MKKYQKIILIILGLIIVLLIGLTCFYPRKKDTSVDPKISLKTFQENYEKNMKSVDENMVPLEQYFQKDEKNKQVYHFKNCYLVIGYNEEKQVEKVYVHIPKEDYKKEEWTSKLMVLVQSMKETLTKEDAKKIVLKMQEVENKESDEVGMLVQFSEDNREYITMEKENKTMLEFFIYVED